MDLTKLSNRQIIELLEADNVPEISERLTVELSNRKISEEEVDEIKTRLGINSETDSEKTMSLGVRSKILILLLPFIVIFQPEAVGVAINLGSKKSQREFTKYLFYGFCIYTILFLILMVLYYRVCR